MEHTKKKKTGYLILVAVGALLYFLNIYLNERKLFLDTSVEKEREGCQILIDGNYVQQNFYTDHDMEIALQLCVITWDKTYDQDDLLIISVVDQEGKGKLYETEYKANSFSDHQLSKFLRLEGVPLQAGHWYGIRVESNIRDEEKPIAVAYVENTLPEITNAIQNGEPIDANLSLKVWE